MSTFEKCGDSKKGQSVQYTTEMFSRLKRSLPSDSLDPKHYTALMACAKSTVAQLSEARCDECYISTERCGQHLK